MHATQEGANQSAFKPVRLGTIGQISVTVRDLEQATAFYRDSLGMRYLFSAPGMAFFDCGGIRLMLGIAEGSGAEDPGSILYYRVDDIQDAYRTLSERGVQFIDQPHRVASLPDHELWMTFFRDSSNRVLALMSEVPHS